MITCSRCGNIVSAGQSSCQYCGMPVMNRSEYGANAGKVSPDQPELPAWLQSLRAGTQPTYATGGNSSFSASDLVEEGALPGWMKPGQPGQPNAATNPTDPHADLLPSSKSAPDTDGSVFPDGSMSASSLIDEQALPSWMREQSGDRQGLPAANLVQPDALPDWLRDAQAGQQPQQSLPQQVSGQAGVARSPQAQPVPPSLTGALQGQPIPSGQSSQVQSGQLLQTPAAQSMFPAQGLAARDLVDAQSLPPWLSGQPGAPANGEVLSAASLLDMNALPSWLRENSQGSQGPQVSQSANMNGSSLPPAVPMQPVPPQQPPAGNLVAASFIDMDALPDWLRSASDGQAGGAMPDQSRAVNAGMPPRVENVRVPGRPRGGAGPQEASTAAANVFASMLGVASNAPQLPAQPYPPQQGWGPQVQAPFQSGQGMVPGPTQAQGYPVPMQGYESQGYQAGLQGQQGYPGYPNFSGSPVSSQLGVSQPLPNQGMSMPPVQPGQSGQPKQNAQGAKAGQGEQGKSAKPARRGFLDTIREWFRF